MLKYLLCSLVSVAAVDVSAAGDAWSSANPERFAGNTFDKALWHENFSGTELPFAVEYRDGAKGKVELTDGGRSGGRALRTVKSNDEGYIVIRFKKSIPVKKGDRLQLNAFYQGKRSLPQYSLAMLRLQLPGQKDFKLYSFYPGINGGERLQEVVNTPPGTWERKFSQRQAQEGMTVFEPVLVLAGAASEIIWDDFYVEDDNISAQNWDLSLNRRPPADRSGDMISEEELNRKLASDIEHTGKVVRIDGKSRLLIDGKVTVPVINGPYGKYVVGKTYSNARDFGAAGIHLTKVALRLGQGKPEQTYSGCWTGRDQLDVSGAVDTIRRNLRLNPDAKIILSIMLHPYWQFTKEFPEEAWIGENGYPVYGSGVHLVESPKPKPTKDTQYVWPSYQSEILNGLYKEQIGKIVAELKRTGLSKAVVGIHIGGGHDNQMTVTHLDYSMPALRAFRKYLKEQYRTVEALRAAWRNDKVTFETAQAPKFNSSHDCLNPETERDCIDFYRFSKFAAWRAAGEIADYTKKLFGKEVFTMRWCMGPYDGSMASTLDFDDFLRVQKFDALVAQAAYNRRPPASACSPRIPIDSFHRHGKLYVNEFDIRTWNAAPSWEKEIMSITWGLILDLPMWQASNRKLAGSMFAHDMGHWYLDMAPGWFDHPGIMADIREATAAGNLLANRKPSHWKPDTAFVVDGDGMFLRNVPSPKWMFDVSALIGYQINLLGLSGVPYAYYTLNDLLEDPELAQSFKVIVFAGMFHIDEPRLKLLESLKNGGRTLVFLSGTGRLGGADRGSGIRVKAEKRRDNHFVKAENGVKENMLSYWMIRKSVSLNGKPQWYDYMPVVYALPEPGDRILARFAVNGQPAVLERRNPGWKAVYIGEAGGLTPEYFNRIVREAGAYRLADSGFQCETNGNFMSVHCMRGGRTVFAMPYKADVVNLFNGRKYSGVTEIPVDAEAGSTYWFSLTPAK